ncbi:GAF domain-containing protein [Paracoccus liaowanqingii]|nr:GAF domain-containing protein [Paracoccus liaowanqingii]
MPINKLESVGLFSLDRTPVFDHVVEMARNLLDCKVSLISLIDDPNDRQFFKAEAGLPLPWSERRQTPLSHSLCKTVVAYGAPLIIADARHDERFKNNGAVGDLGVVAYLGVPLKDETGTAFGALCVIDTESRVWVPEDVDLLLALSEGVTAQIRQMLASPQSDFAAPKYDNGNFSLLAAVDNQGDAVLSYTQGSDGREKIDLVSGGCEKIWEFDCEGFKDRFSNLFAMCVSEDIINARVSLGISAACLSHWHHEWHIVTPSGVVRQLLGDGDPTVLQGGGIMWSVIVRDVTNNRPPYMPYAA